MGEVEFDDIVIVYEMGIIIHLNWTLSNWIGNGMKKLQSDLRMIECLSRIIEFPSRIIDWLNRIIECLNRIIEWEIL